MIAKVCSFYFKIYIRDGTVLENNLNCLIAIHFSGQFYIAGVILFTGAVM